MNRSKHKVAFIHRYGLEGWICCGGHAVPEIIKQLSASAEIHFYGPRITEGKNSALRSNLQIHELPYIWNRANPKDKITKTLLWYFWLPIIGIRCRLNGTQLIWNDETVPLTAPILRVCFGKNVAITVMDFFARIYTDKHPRLHWLRDLIERIDFAAWKKLPLIFTKVLYTQEFLAEKGVPREIMHLYRNPVDHTKFHPVDEQTRQATRAKFGFTDDDIVLTHHGILHPNKGNDWMLQRLAECTGDMHVAPIKFLLIGNGPEMDNLKKQAKKLGIADRVVFAGWLPSETDLNNALASADIGLVMRIGQETDHFHMTDTLAHEMACGKPILAVNLKGIAEVIRDGENGDLFSPSESKTFRERIMGLATNSELRSRRGAAALKKSLDISGLPCSIQQVATSLSSIMMETTSSKPKKDLLFHALTTAKRVADGLSREVRYSFPHPNVAVSARDAGEAQGCTYTPLGLEEKHDLFIPKGIDPAVRYRFEEMPKGCIPERFLLEIENGRVFGEGHVITPDNRLVSDVSIYFSQHEHHWLLGIGKLPEPVKIKGTVAVLDSPGSSNYFHWTFDTLPRFNLLKSHLQSIDWFYVGSTAPFQRAWLEKLGIPSDKILSISSRSHIIAEHLLIPSFSHKSGCYSHATYDNIRSFLPTQSPATRKIYISRSHARRRRITNEEEILPILTELGYEVHHLAGMSLDQQMELFNSATHIIAPHGAELTNLVYCQPGTKVLELFSPYYVNLCFWVVASEVGLDYACQIGLGGETHLRKRRTTYHVWKNIKLDPTTCADRLIAFTNQK